MRHALRLSALLVSVLLPAVGAAQDAQPLLPDSEAALETPAADLVIELGGAALLAPAYEGSDEYTLSPVPLASIEFLRLPGLFELGGGADQGLSLFPSFRMVGERDDDDFDGLEGLGDVDRAIELGGGVAYQYAALRGYVAVRRGFGGHEGLVGETGVDVLAAPSPGLTLGAGPRVTFASQDYVQTYFGVTPAQAALSRLPAYDAEGGIKSVGVEGEARYELTENWALNATLGYQHLVGDAADSPVTALGSEHQFSASLGLTRRFSFDLFD